MLKAGLIQHGFELEVVEIIQVTGNPSNGSGPGYKERVEVDVV